MTSIYELDHGDIEALSLALGEKRFSTEYPALYRKYAKSLAATAFNMETDDETRGLLDDCIRDGEIAHVMRDICIEDVKNELRSVYN